MKADADEVRDILASVKELTLPIIEEIEGEEEMRRLKEENDYLDDLQNDTRRSEEIEQKSLRKQSKAKSEGDIYEIKYKAKLEARCEEQLSRGSERCRYGILFLNDYLLGEFSFSKGIKTLFREMFADAFDKCNEKVSWAAAWLLCWPMKLDFVCNIVQALGGSSICDPDGKIDPGIGEGYATLKGTDQILLDFYQDQNIWFFQLSFRTSEPRF